MLADLTKCVLTLLSSPAPGGGPGSQGLRAQQGWVSAAEGQPQTSLGVEKKKEKEASSHKHPVTQKSTSMGGGGPHQRQHTRVGGGQVKPLQERRGGAIAWPTVHAIGEELRSVAPSHVPEKSAKVQSWCVLAGAARGKTRRLSEKRRLQTATVLLHRATGSMAEGSRHQLLQQVMLLLMSKSESITYNAVRFVNVAGKAQA